MPQATFPEIIAGLTALGLLIYVVVMAFFGSGGGNGGTT